MTTQRPTAPQTDTCRPSIAPEHTTWAPLSRNRFGACVWVSSFDFGRGSENLSALTALVGVK